MVKMKQKDTDNLFEKVLLALGILSYIVIAYMILIDYFKHKN